MFTLKKSKNIGNLDSSAALLLPSRKEAVILELLIGNEQELFGLQMVEASNGALKRGTIYVTLQRMTEKGFIDSKPEPRPAPEIGIARRVYWATGVGERAFAAYQAALTILAADPVIA
jgi:DNA-binding PadR family transcriptional regulator